MWAAFLSVRVWAQEPKVVYLTWTTDPTSSMTILWHTDREDAETKVDFREGGAEWKEAKGGSWEIQETDTRVHRVDLMGLESDQRIVFKVGGSEREYWFRTMPKELSRPVRFAIGGDGYYYWGAEVFQRMNRMIAHHDPDFVVMGGDLAYTTGKKRVFKGRGWELTRWQTFLRMLQQTIKGSEKRMIPFVFVVGNHDIKKRSSKPQMFYDLFAFPEEGKAYQAIDIGSYLSLITLDTGHTWPIDGEQTTWLEKRLQERADRPFLFAAYHEGAYPSYYPYMNKTSVLLRQRWTPLFEKYQVLYAFEHHNHCYKRTRPIREGKVDPSGVVYLGDGSWGVSPRKPHQGLWYMEKASSVNACMFVTLTQEKCSVEAKDTRGSLIDRIESSPREVGIKTSLLGQ